MQLVHRGARALIVQLSVIMGPRKYLSEPGEGYTNGSFKDHGIQPASPSQPEKDMMVHGYLRCVVAEEACSRFQMHKLRVRSGTSINNAHVFSVDVAGWQARRL